MPQTQINVEVRRRYAALLRRYFSGKVTNFQYEKEAEDLPYEPAVHEIHTDAMWFLYDDIREHRALPLSREDRRIIARIILFLRTDAPIKPRPPWSRAQWVSFWLFLAIFAGWPVGIVMVGAGSYFNSPLTMWAGAALLAPFPLWYLTKMIGHAFERLRRRSQRTEPADPYWPFTSAEALRSACRQGSGFLGSRDPLVSGVVT